MTLVLFLAVLALLVLVHEAGHFFAAKLFKIRVDEFGFGFPPRLFSFVRGETRYSVNLIPFGGFVKIFGEDGETKEVTEKPEEKRRNFACRSRAIQAFVLVAGIVGNLLLAWLLISLGLMGGMPAPEGELWGVPVRDVALTVVDILPDSPARAAGLKAGDTIVSLIQGGHTLDAPNTDTAGAFIADAPAGSAITVGVVRQGHALSFSITPVATLIQGRQVIGIAMEMVGLVQLSPPRALWEGAKITGGLVGETARALGGFVRDAFMGTANWKNFAGPVGIAGLVGEARTEGIVPLLTLVALISVNLALINLIPFPALDGGRLLFVAIEAVHRKPLPQKFTHTTNAVGFFLLLVFLAVVTFHDLLRLFRA